MASNYNGIYLSHGFNETLNHVKQTRSVDGSGEGKGDKYNENKFTNYFGIGYGKVFNRFYLGTEFGLQLGYKYHFNYDTDLSGLHAVSPEIKRDIAFEFTVRPGYLISKKWMVYGVAGAAFSKYHFNLDMPGGISLNGNKNLSQWMYGLGTSYSLNKHLVIGLEVIETAGGKVDISEAPLGLSFAAENAQYHVKPHNESIMFRTSYVF